MSRETLRTPRHNMEVAETLELVDQAVKCGAFDKVGNMHAP